MITVSPLNGLVDDSAFQILGVSLQVEAGVGGGYDSHIYLDSKIRITGPV